MKKKKKKKNNERDNGVKKKKREPKKRRKIPRSISLPPNNLIRNYIADIHGSKSKAYALLVGSLSEETEKMIDEIKSFTGIYREYALFQMSPKEFKVEVSKLHDSLVMSKP